MDRCDVLILKRSELKSEYDQLKSAKMPQFSEIDEDYLREDVRNEIKEIDKDKIRRESLMERVKVVVDWNLSKEQI